MDEHIDLSLTPAPDYSAVPSLHAGLPPLPCADDDVDACIELPLRRLPHRVELYRSGVLAVTDIKSRQTTLLPCELIDIKTHKAWRLPVWCWLVLSLATAGWLWSLLFSQSHQQLINTAAVAALCGMLALVRLQLHYSVRSVGADIELLALLMPLGRSDALARFIEQLQDLVSQQQRIVGKVPLPSLVAQHRRFAADGLISQQDYDRAKSVLFKAYSL